MFIEVYDLGPKTYLGVELNYSANFNEKVRVLKLLLFSQKQNQATRAGQHAWVLIFNCILAHSLL